MTLRIRTLVWLVGLALLSTGTTNQPPMYCVEKTSVPRPESTTPRTPPREFPTPRPDEIDKPVPDPDAGAPDTGAGSPKG